MKKAIAYKQIILTVHNEVGALAEISKILSKAGINLLAICGYAVDNKGIIMFVSQDHDKAKKLLKTKNYDVREEDVVLLTVDNKTGALQSIVERIAQGGIDLTLIYGSAEKKGKTSSIVLVAEDNDMVLQMINLM